VLRHADQHVVGDPSGWNAEFCRRFTLESSSSSCGLRLARGVDAGTFSPHARGSREYVAIEHGILHLTLNGDLVVLRAGDSIYYHGDCHHRFENRGRRHACTTSPWMSPQGYLRTPHDIESPHDPCGPSLL
jgi:mannose-6-phosphate isomerase-like protein (cupin superfamily)